MLPPIIGVITPYRRLCGSIFLTIAVVVAPNLHFALSLAVSRYAAQLSIWGMVGLYLLIIVAPPLQRITNNASLVALASALVLVVSSMALATHVKQVIATTIGFYADTAPWLDAEPREPTRAYRNPFAGYTLSIPASWVQLPGPIEGTDELVLPAPSTNSMAARLRPVCDLTEDPLPMTVAGMLTAAARVKRSCLLWRGLESCLLERGVVTEASAKTPLRWEWLGHDPSSRVQIRLIFELYDERARADALAIINSARVAEGSFNASPCPNPIEWAEEFPGDSS